jgi:hypothetical protein
MPLLQAAISVEDQLSVTYRTFLKLGPSNAELLLGSNLYAQ